MVQELQQAAVFKHNPEKKKIPPNASIPNRGNLFKMLFHTLYKYSKDIHTNVRTTLQKVKPAENTQTQITQKVHSMN